LEVLQCPALRVTVLDRVPARELVLIKLGSEWELTLVDKKLTRGWRKNIAACIRKTLGLCQAEGESLARDLTALLVDPDNRYGMVVPSRESIPTDYRSSDVLRDLQRSGLSTSEVRARLLSRSPPEIRSIEMTATPKVAVLTYYSWDYFGGEVVAWRISFKPRVSVTREVLAVGVGSFDLYF
jgi:hypothetical protein